MIKYKSECGKEECQYLNYIAERKA